MCEQATFIVDNGYTYVHVHVNINSHGNNYRNITGVDLLSSYIANTIFEGDLY